MTGSNTSSSVTTSTTSTTSSTDAHAGAGTHAATGANAGASTHVGTSTHAVTGANANVSVQHSSPRPAAIPAPTIEALYRAALTFCLDGTDVMMYATLKGAPSAESLWHALAQSHPSNPDNVSGPALGRIDRMFVNGITRWGRSVSADMMASFRTSLASWHNRMRDLPSQDIMQLANWFTVDGTMWLIGPDHPCWPHQLADLAIRSDWAPPLCLWIRGDPRALTSCPNPIGIVGSRDVNEYGRYVAHTMAEQAAAAGHLVVSGGAMGTDAAAHWGALNALHGRNPANVGKTVAVFAGGLNHMGPMRNRTLFERIEAQGGALISEHCPNTIPEARRFLLRNRIIAALSSTLVVAQARLRSGALNTAGWACELMREVYAVPGDINQPGNAGCNKMISDHRAILLCAATSTEDICHERHRPIMTTYASQPGTLSKAGSTGQPTHETAQSTASNGASLPAEEETATGTATAGAASPTSPAQAADQRPSRSAPPGRPSNARAMKPASGGMTSSARQRMPDMPDITPHESRTASAASEARRSPTAGNQPTLMQTTLMQTFQSDSIGRYDDGPVDDLCHQDAHAGTSTRRMPDLRTPSESQEDAEPRIDPNTLPEPQREMVGLIRECRRRHLIVTPDALLRVARELHNDEIPNIGTVLELLGALELKGVVTRQADGVMLSDRVR